MVGHFQLHFPDIIAKCLKLWLLRLNLWRFFVKILHSWQKNYMTAGRRGRAKYQLLDKSHSIGVAQGFVR